MSPDCHSTDTEGVEETTTASSTPSVLSTRQAAALARRGARFVPVAPPVTAHRLTEPVTWETKRGDVMHGEPGDWAIEDRGRTRTLTDDVFRSTYRSLPDGTFQKVTPVHACQLAEACAVQSLEGESEGAAGDWIVTNGDDAWIVRDTDFTSRYARR